VSAAVVPRFELLSDGIMVAVSQKPADAAEMSGNVQKGTVLDFHKRFDHLSYDFVERRAKDPSFGIHLTDHMRVKCLSAPRASRQRTGGPRSSSSTLSFSSRRSSTVLSTFCEPSGGEYENGDRFCKRTGVT
jgi:hypothetical protein